MQQLKEMYRKQAEIDNKVRLDLGDEERKKKLERACSRIRSTDEVTESYTWRQGSEGDVSDPVSKCVAVLMLLGSGLTWTRPPDWEISLFNIGSHLITSWSA